MARSKAAGGKQAAMAVIVAPFDGNGQLLPALFCRYLPAYPCETSRRHRPRKEKRDRIRREDRKGEMAGEHAFSFFLATTRAELDLVSVAALVLFNPFAHSPPFPLLLSAHLTPPPLPRTRSSPPTPSTASPSPRTATSRSSACCATSAKGSSSRCATTRATRGGSWPDWSRSRSSTTRCASRPACTLRCE